MKIQSFFKTIFYDKVASFSIPSSVSEFIDQQKQQSFIIFDDQFNLVQFVCSDKIVNISLLHFGYIVVELKGIHLQASY